MKNFAVRQSRYSRLNPVVSKSFKYLGDEGINNHNNCIY